MKAVAAVVVAILASGVIAAPIVPAPLSNSNTTVPSGVHTKYGSSPIDAVSIGAISGTPNSLSNMSPQGHKKRSWRSFSNGPSPQSDLSKVSQPVLEKQPTQETQLSNSDLRDGQPLGDWSRRQAVSLTPKQAEKVNKKLRKQGFLEESKPNSKNQRNDKENKQPKRDVSDETAAPGHIQGRPEDHIREIYHDHEKRAEDGGKEPSWYEDVIGVFSQDYAKNHKVQEYREKTYPKWPYNETPEHGRPSQKRSTEKNPVENPSEIMEGDNEEEKLIKRFGWPWSKSDGGSGRTGPPFGRDPPTRSRAEEDFHRKVINILDPKGPYLNPGGGGSNGGDNYHDRLAKRSDEPALVNATPVN